MDCEHRQTDVKEEMKRLSKYAPIYIIYTYIIPYTEIVYGAHSLAITLPSIFKIRRWLLCARADMFCCWQWFDSPDAQFTTPCKSMAQPAKHLSQNLPLLKYTRLSEIEVMLNVICIHQLMLPSKCFCF